MRKDFADVDFPVDRLITQAEQVKEVGDSLRDVDGILVIHLSMGITPILAEILKSRRPTVVFAAPYSGHEWTSFGALRKGEDGALLECILSSNFDDLAVAVRPFRAIHHLREAKIINVSTRQPADDYLKATREKFGTEIKTVGLQPVMDAYNSISRKDAEAETELWIRQAERVVEPPRDEIYRSCQLALAFEKILAQEKATCLTVDCYGSMYRQLPAFPCVGFVRLNNMGLGGICESDLQSAMTHILVQGLSGKAGIHQRSDHGRVGQGHHPRALPGIAQDGRARRAGVTLQAANDHGAPGGLRPAGEDAPRPEGDAAAADRHRQGHLLHRHHHRRARHRQGMPDTDHRADRRRSGEALAELDGRAASDHGLWRHNSRPETILPFQEHQADSGGMTALRQTRNDPAASDRQMNGRGLLAEDQRLLEDARRERNWKRWGPYLSERQWGTVREDYSPDGDAWHTSPMIMPAAGLTDGVRMACSASPTVNAACASP